MRRVVIWLSTMTGMSQSCAANTLSRWPMGPLLFRPKSVLLHGSRCLAWHNTQLSALHATMDATDLMDPHLKSSTSSSSACGNAISCAALASGLRQQALLLHKK